MAVSVAPVSRKAKQMSHTDFRQRLAHSLALHPSTIDAVVVAVVAVVGAEPTLGTSGAFWVGCLC